MGKDNRSFIQYCLTSLGEEYGIPVFENAKEMMAVFPPQDVSELAPLDDYEHWHTCFVLSTQLGDYRLCVDPQDFLFGARRRFVLVAPNGDVIQLPSGNQFRISDSVTTWTFDLIGSTFTVMAEVNIHPTNVEQLEISAE